MPNPKLARLIEIYTELQYPDDDTYAQLTDQQLNARADEARRVAVQIAELVIKLGLHR